MNFHQYCASKNIHLLYEDKVFIKRCMSKVPRNEHRSVLRDYVEKWRDGMEEEENIVAKQNTGRMWANSWLREFTCDL